MRLRNNYFHRREPVEHDPVDGDQSAVCFALFLSPFSPLALLSWSTSYLTNLLYSYSCTAKSNPVQSTSTQDVLSVIQISTSSTTDEVVCKPVNFFALLFHEHVNCHTFEAWILSVMVSEMTDSGIRTLFRTIMSNVMARIVSAGFTPNVSTKLSKCCKVNKCDIWPYRSLLHSAP